MEEFIYEEDVIIEEEIEVKAEMMEESEGEKGKYLQVSNISRTESRNLNVSSLGLRLSLRNISKPGVRPRMKM